MSRLHRRAKVLAVALALGAAWAAGAQSRASGPERPAPTRIEVAPGIHVFITAGYGDVGLDGNSVAIVSNDGVLVFDTNGTPAAAAAVLAEIRRLTPRPVRYVVNSHWHWDHWYGTEVYREAFPDVRVIAHDATRRMMLGPALDFNKPGLERDLPGYVKSLEERLAAARTKSPPSPDVEPLEKLLAADRFFLQQKASVRHVAPELTYDSRLEIRLGERRIQVLHRDRAVTPGDSYLYLPDEKVLITGDLLVNPIPFALSCYPSGWIRTLEALDALDAAVLVPGHGQPLRDETLLHATLDALRELQRRGLAARARGLEVDAARDEMLPELRETMLRLTRGDARLEEQFRVYLADWFLHRVYDEAGGPLGDEIAAIPAR